jgi:hypothetical protein
MNAIPAFAKPADLWGYRPKNGVNPPSYPPCKDPWFVEANFLNFRFTFFQVLLI